MCKLDILQAYDFRPDLERSCPTSTGGESTITPAITGTSVGQSSSPVAVRTGVGGGVETERDEEIIVTVVNDERTEVGLTNAEPVPTSVI